MSKLSINFDSSAEFASRQLAQLERRLEKTMERISSGERINSTEDNPVGFVVREQMRADMAVKQKGLENFHNAIALVQTAEGALDNVTGILMRMKELATQAASANVTTDRVKLQEEFVQLADEIDRLANGSEFNGRKLLDGSLATTGIRIQFGTGNNPASDYLMLTLDGSGLTDLGLNGASVETQESAQTAMDSIDAAIGTVSSSRGALGAYQNRLERMQDHLMVSLENLQASESIISDTDMAQAMVDLTRDQILREAVLASLAQASDLSAQAVSLLLRG